MNSEAEHSVVEIDAMAFRSLLEFNAYLRSLTPPIEANVVNLPATVSGVAAGLRKGIHLQFAADVGNYFYFLGADAQIEVHGSCGACTAYQMESGSLLIRNSADDFLGAFAKGGFLGVHGKAGNDCGYALAGADIVVRSTCGDRAGCGMSGGDLVLCNGSGAELGLNMVGGTIFVRGTAKPASGVREVRMKSAEALRLSLLLARAGIKGDVKDFRVYRPREPQE
ncbi:MAG: tributyrin esterase [Pirellulaceae bacterium]|nr:MAG: tributyrin esterase [Pirellulaceae bacterium]